MWNERVRRGRVCQGTLPHLLPEQITAFSNQECTLGAVVLRFPASMVCR